MSINATTSSVNSSSSVSNSGSSAEVSKKTSSDSSFKDEMNKVTKSEKANDDKNVEKSPESKVDDSVPQKNNQEMNSTDNSKDNQLSNAPELSLEGNIDYSKFASMSMIDVNSMLSNDIEQMINNTTINQLPNLTQMSEITKSAGMFTLDFSDNISVSQSDAEFFINLTQNNDVSVQNITTQAQSMLNQGANVKEVQQNVRISETLLNAINQAKETNQPLRIDFDQNVSVILRIGKDGAIAANFIPGDKAVEQYLKNNIESLKNTFNENDLPYSDLSYSNRGSKQQKERRNNQK